MTAVYARLRSPRFWHPRHIVLHIHCIPPASSGILDVGASGISIAEV